MQHDHTEFDTGKLGFPSNDKPAGKKVKVTSPKNIPAFTPLKENMAEKPVIKKNKKVLAGLMGIFFGGLGIHKFILGYKKSGLIMLLGSLLTFGLFLYVFVIIGFIEGIIYLTKSDDEFYKIYQEGQKNWF